MKKFLLSIMLIFALIAKAENNFPNNKYKGFLELGPVLKYTNKNNSYFKLSFSTTHGYQATDLMFIGAGIGVDFLSNEKIIPLYVAARLSLIENELAPYINFKGGYSLGDFKGGYVEPGFGIRIPTQRKFAINLTMSYMLNIRFYSYKNNTAIEKRECHNSIMLKLGIEF